MFSLLASLWEPGVVSGAAGHSKKSGLQMSLESRLLAGERQLGLGGGIYCFGSKELSPNGTDSPQRFMATGRGG